MNKVNFYHNDRTSLSHYLILLKHLPQALSTSKGLWEMWLFDSKG